MPRPHPATPRAAHNFPGPPRDLFVPGTNDERPRATQWVAPTLGHNVGARHCLALIRRRPAPPTISQARLAICLFRARTSASARTTEGDPVGRPYVGTQCRGAAMPRPHPAAPRAAHNFPGPPRDLFVPGMNERLGMNEGDPVGRPYVGTQCRGEALPTLGPRPHPAAPRAAHNFPGLPRDLFVPGMNDRGRPSGSPLRWDTM